MKRSGFEATWAGSRAILGTLALLGGCREAPDAPEPGPRPVEAVVLAVSDPSVQLRVPGVVESWVEEDIAFEVSGHVDFVTQEGRQVRGRWAEGDEVLVEGDALARVDKADFEAAVIAAEADLEAARIERDRVAPATVTAARAREAESKSDLERTRRLHEQDAANERELTQAETAVEVATSQVAVAEANVAAAGAAVLGAESALNEARLDLSRTEILAPFTGEVAETYIAAGAFVRPGTPVVRLTMVDPVEIAVQVSAETSRRIARNDIGRIYVEGYDGPLVGKVHRKSTTADPGTQTFTVTVMARNRRLAVQDKQVADVGPDAVPIADITIPQFAQDGQPGPLFVDERRVLQRDEQGWYVWAIDGWTIDRMTENRPDVLILQRVRVTAGEERLNYQGIYVLRSLADPGTLKPEQVLAIDVPPDTRDGATAVLTAQRWAVRPGDVVWVDFGTGPAGEGFYVPQEAVVVTGEAEGRIFLLGEGSTVRAVAVGLGQVVNGMQLVESPEFDSAPAGARVVARGAAALTDGDPVAVTGEGP